MARDKAADRELREARRELARVAEQERRRGIREETDEFLVANARVIEAERRVPWHRR